ncbi:MAG: restriction endonuclease [Muribaculaceae bacterium]|nr:restriction endonuclease [Muribaculaceae bacterium]
MDKIATIKKILSALDLPPRQQSDLCALTILAMAGISNGKSWSKATNAWTRIHDIIAFINEHFDVNYAENSRETFRKQALHHFRNAAIVEDNGMATNSPNYRWRLTDEFLSIIHHIGKSNSALILFKEHHESLTELYASKKSQQKLPVNINGNDFSFSPGKHNQLQKAIIEEFAPRFAPNTVCLYVGDTVQKDLVKLEQQLAELGFSISLHDKMPDVVLYNADKDWLYFIEAVTSVGPMDPKRIIEINQMTAKVKSGKIFITAFLDFATYKKFAAHLAWDTEVWIAEMPDHMIHMNGDRFLGPR